MFFRRRRKYNGAVAELLPEFGFDLEDAGVMKTLDVLDIAWQQGYSKHEAALFVGYLVYSGMHKAGEGRAADVRERIRAVQRGWVEDGVVRAELAEQFETRMDGALGSESRLPSSSPDTG
ncbi:MAG: hypothetical protein FKY71_13195 [Spiribacter salinus]|uniref:Uncharacterized protein n=1 Tax=Spiribacter salinus TaxID=1335746 RepID=A0A540VP64_9GAMM|nr:MAG: hypothetical protein FKY71_13195 [Spiribacter salinus]